VKGHEIIKTVAAEHRLHIDDMLGRCRVDYLVAARRDAAIRLRGANFPIPQIAKMLKRDHSTIINYIDGGHVRKSRYFRKRALQFVNPQAQAVILETAKLERTTPEIIIAEWVNERARCEMEAKARAA
jgi:IS30 family transposase